MPINETYRTWIQRICELRPRQRKTQVQNFVWLVDFFHNYAFSRQQTAVHFYFKSSNARLSCKTLTRGSPNIPN